MRRLAIVLVLAMIAIAASSCRKAPPCEALAKAICAAESGAECDNITLQSQKAGEAEQEMCVQISAIRSAAAAKTGPCGELATMACSELSLQECLNMRKEAAGADEKKSTFCEKMKGIILDTRRTHSERAAAATEEKDSGAVEEEVK